MFGLFSKKKEPQKVEPKIKPKPEVKPKKMGQVDDFDKSEYTKEIFKTIFHSIRNDNDWKSNFSYREIKFTKSAKGDRGTWAKSVSVEFEYGFDISDGTFKLKEAKLNPPTGSSLSYPKSSGKYENVVILDSEMMTFLYDSYVNWKEQENATKKKEVDDSIRSINDIIGISSIRDSKIDELLG